MANGQQEPDPNPVTTVWETTDNTLTKKETHERPVTKVTTYNVNQEQAEIDKIDGIIAQWEAKKQIRQQVIAKHTEEHNKPKGN